MIKINFIPQEVRRDRGNYWAEGFGPLSREVILGIFVIAAMVLVCCHLLLAGLALTKVAQQSILAVRWSALAPKKKVLDDVVSETKALQVKMSALKAITSAQGITWAQVLNGISDSVPNGVWIREIRFSKGILAIEGSAVSKVRNEMIIVNNFVTALKEKPSVTAGFMGVDVDSIERRKDTALSIADFSLRAQRKNQ